MVIRTFEDMFPGFNMNRSEDKNFIPASSVELPVTLPRDYQEFLEWSDGGDGNVGPNSYLILWRASELLCLNQAYEVATCAPGLLLFGSNGGGEAYGFDLRDGRQRVVSIPFVGMDLELAHVVAETFTKFLQRLATE